MKSTKTSELGFLIAACGVIPRERQKPGSAFHCGASSAATVAPEKGTTYTPSRHRSCSSQEPLAALLTEQSSLPPGTTSLLVRIDSVNVNVANAQSWIREWLRIYIFGAQGTMSVPVSMDIDGKGAILYFYAPDGAKRGLLALSMEQEGEDGGRNSKLVLRATSASRFVNPSGTFTATLPGERRIIRTLYSDVEKEFEGKVTILYKPPYIRLRKASRASSNSSKVTPITVFAGEVRNVASSDTVLQFLRSWGMKAQFGAGLGRNIWRSAFMPPIALKTIDDGVELRVLRSGQVELSTGQPAEITMVVRKRAAGNKFFKQRSRSHRASSDLPDENRQPGTDKDISDGIRLKKAIVIVSATHPDETGTRAILQSFSADLLREFPKSRIHSPGISNKSFL